MKKILFALLLIPSFAFADPPGMDVTPEAPKIEQIVKFLDEDGVYKWRDVYSGPQGFGYIDGEEAIIEGVRYYRTRHVGPEDREDTKWEWVNA